MDDFDRKILASLEMTGNLTNAELAERVGLSPSQCSRRRSRLEREGYILWYRAGLNRQKIGYDLLVLIAVTLNTHTRGNAQRFRELVNSRPEVLEGYALTGEKDYSLKVGVPDLAALSHFVSDVLLPHETVQRVSTSIVLETLKEGGLLSLR